MTGTNEIRVRGRAGVERPAASPLGVEVRRSLSFSSLPTPDLNGLQLQIVECLREAGRSLTERQLGVRVLCPSETLQEALDSLVEWRVVARLNTIIPSYVDRSEDSQIPAG